MIYFLSGIVDSYNCYAGHLLFVCKKESIQENERDKCNKYIEGESK